MFKKILIAATSAGIVMGVSSLAMVGCSNDAAMHPGMEQTVLSGKSASVVYNHARLTNFVLDNQGSDIIARPTQQIKGTTNYVFDCPNCKPGSPNQILVGLAGRSAQACIFNGGSNGQGVAEFLLKAPAKSGTYDIRFRTAQAADCQEALKSWWDMGNPPAKEATVGKLVVQRKIKHHDEV